MSGLQRWPRPDQAVCRLSCFLFTRAKFQNKTRYRSLLVLEVKVSGSTQFNASSQLEEPVTPAAEMCGRTTADLQERCLPAYCSDRRNGKWHATLSMLTRTLLVWCVRGNFFLNMNWRFNRIDLMQFSLSLLQYIHIGSTGFRVIQRDFRRSRNTRLKVHHMHERM